MLLVKFDGYVYKLEARILFLSPQKIQLPMAFRPQSKTDTPNLIEGIVGTISELIDAGKDFLNR